VDVKTGRPRLAAQAVALATLCAVLFLTFLDNTIVSVGLANVQSDLHAGVASLQWVVNGYALTFAAFMLAGGPWAICSGARRSCWRGVAVFCAGSVVAALAPNVDWLIVGRVMMGLGAAASEPGTLSIIRHVYPDKSTRADALGVWAAVSGSPWPSVPSSGVSWWASRTGGPSSGSTWPSGRGLRHGPRLCARNV
jgi:MFS family permease